MTRFLQILAALLVLLALPATAFADDWLVIKLRGQVLQLVGGDWAPLERGDVVPDDRVIRSTGSGRAMLQRGKETVEIGSNTQIRILDQTGKRFTTVQQYFGTLAIEAEVQNVQHFAVQTPYLAAVVKGTRFEVKTNKKSSAVKVLRGRVAVEDLHTGASTLIVAGQSATVTSKGAFKVEGKGAKPQILSETGRVVKPADAAKGNVQGSGVGVGVTVGNATVGSGGVAAGVNAGVNAGGIAAQVGAGSGGVSAGATVGNVAGAEVTAGGGGVSVEANVGGTGASVEVGGGNGVSVEVGGVGVSLGLGGLL